MAENSCGLRVAEFSALMAPARRSRRNAGLNSVSDHREITDRAGIGLCVERNAR